MGLACARISACGVGLAATVMVPLLSTASDAVSVDAVSVEAVSEEVVSVLDAQAARDRLSTRASASAMIFFELFHEVYSFDSEKKFHFMEGI